MLLELFTPVNDQCLLFKQALKFYENQAKNLFLLWLKLAIILLNKFWMILLKFDFFC
ncbi:hypothetical protein FDUTEX481_03667 [Tolypothrix sp. PCC 7601]|nr:hypothetical protein FDUTEX481_03667 [Tolypothrix sp. PCC 7601]